jgi:hypothetical protein
MTQETNPRASGYNGLYLMLGNMQGDIKSVLSGFERIEKKGEKRDTEVDHRLNAHADRLTALEKFRWQIAGIAALVPTILVCIGWALQYLL